MRSLIWSLVLGAATLGAFAATPSEAQAQRWRSWGYPVYSSYYYSYPGYYSYSPVYSSYYYTPDYTSTPAYSYYSTPAYSYYSTPGYTSYYTPGYSYYYTPGYYWGGRWRWR